jgi:hypothetical protein
MSRVRKIAMKKLRKMSRERTKTVWRGRFAYGVNDLVLDELRRSVLNW